MWKKRRNNSHLKNNLLIDLINIDQYLLNREIRNQKHRSSN
jgi:hypothetical protein